MNQNDTTLHLYMCSNCKSTAFNLALLPYSKPHYEHVEWIDTNGVIVYCDNCDEELIRIPTTTDTYKKLTNE